MAFWIAAGIVLLALLLHILLPWMIKIILRRRFLARAAQSPHAFLTFDDGPNPDATPAILELLKAHGAQATFFVVGTNAEKSPEIVRAIRKEGHALGTHSYRHTHAWKTDPLLTVMDLFRASNFLSDLGSPAPRLFRPPFGKLNLGSLIYIFARKCIVAFWNIDPQDYEKLNGSLVAAHVVSRLRPGSVILLHDGSWNSSRSAANTVEAVRIILEAGRSKGLSFASLDALLAPGDS